MYAYAGGDELDSHFHLADRHERRLGHHKKVLSSASMKTSELVNKFIKCIFDKNFAIYSKYS